jgi:uncharacterized protein DUF6230
MADRTIQGRTRWRRFGILFAPAVAAVGLLGYGVLTGAVAFSFAISGVPFQLSATTLSGTGFTQYGTIAPVSAHGSVTAGGTQYDAVTVTELASATITGLDQTVCGPTPLGNYMLVEIKTPASADTTATNLVVGAPLVAGTGGATFNSINIGQDLSTATGHGSGDLGQFAQTAASVSISGLQQVAISTSAGTFNLPGRFTVYASFVNSCPAAFTP